MSVSSSSRDAAPTHARLRSLNDALISDLDRLVGPRDARLMGVVRVVSADGDPMPVLVDDVPELVGVLGQAGDVSDHHEVRPAGRHLSKNRTTPLRGADAEGDLRNRVNRHHADSIAPVLQLPNLPVERITAL